MRGPGVAASFALLVLAGLMTSANAYRAIRLAALPERIPAVLPAAPGAVATPRPLAETEYLTAAERNPFNPARKRPLSRFPVPGKTQVAQTAAPLVAAFPVRTLRLAGTTAFGNGKGFAMIESPGQPARLYRPGDTLAGFVLRRVDRAEAELRSRDSTIVLKLLNRN